MRTVLIFSDGHGVKTFWIALWAGVWCQYLSSYAKRMLYMILSLLLILPNVRAADFLLDTEQPLSPDEAFHIQVYRDETGISVLLEPAKGYYLYKERIHLKGAEVHLAAPRFPDGKMKDDPNFGPPRSLHASGSTRMAMAKT